MRKIDIDVKVVTGYFCNIDEGNFGQRFYFAFNDLDDMVEKLRGENKVVESFYLYASLANAAPNNDSRLVVYLNLIEDFLEEIIEKKNFLGANIFCSNPIFYDSKEWYQEIEDLLGELESLSKQYSEANFILEDIDWGLNVLTPRVATAFWCATLSSNYHEYSDFTTEVWEGLYKQPDSSKILDLIQDLAATAPDDIAMLTVEDLAYKLMSHDEIDKDVRKRLLKFVNKSQLKTAKYLIKRKKDY